MNTGVTKSDFIYFQNDTLKDLKNLERTLNEKIEKIKNQVENDKTNADTTFSKYSLLISDMSKKISAAEENSEINEQIDNLKKKLEELSINCQIKINGLEKELNKLTIKYDRIFINNLVVPGLIGSSCPFPTLSNFLDNANKKINELIIDKKKQGMDLKSYKEQLDSLINMFNNKINTSEEKLKEYCKICFDNCNKNSFDRFNSLEERIISLRMENAKYSSELIDRSKEVNCDWDKIMNIKSEIYNKLNSELEKYVKHNNNLLRVFESQKTEFTLIKNRFTELSDFIKDVRFRNNVTSKEINKLNSSNLNASKNNNINNNEFSQLSIRQKKVKFIQMSKRINFRLKQKLDDSFKYRKSKKHLTHIKKNHQEKKENSLRYSPAKTEYLFGDKENNSSEILKEDDIEKDKDKEISIDNKDIDNNQNKEEEKDIQANKDYLINNKPLELDKERNILKNYFNSNNKSFKSRNPILSKKKYKTNINEYPNLLSTKKNNLEDKKNKSTINKDSETELSGDDEKLKSKLQKKKEIKNSRNLKVNIGILKQEMTKVSSIKTLKLNLKDSPKSRNDSKKEKINKRNIKFNKTIKISEINQNEREDKKLKTQVYNPNPNLKIKKEENKSDNKNFKKEKNQPNIKMFKSMSNNTSPIKNDNDNKKTVIPDNKFSFLTNIYIQEKEKEINKNDNTDKFDDIEINEESLNLNMNILNKKIIKINNRLNELYMNTDIKINKIYQYVKKVFDHFSGIFFFKEIYNQKFSSDLTHKSLMANNDSSSILPIQKTNKSKIMLKGNNKFFSPKNLKKQETYKTIVDKIEPFLIKKFKDKI